MDKNKSYIDEKVAEYINYWKGRGISGDIVDISATILRTYIQEAYSKGREDEREEAKENSPARDE